MSKFQDLTIFFFETPTTNEFRKYLVTRAIFNEEKNMNFRKKNIHEKIQKFFGNVGIFFSYTDPPLLAT